MGSKLPPYRNVQTYLTDWASQGALGIKNLPANAGDVRDTDSIPGSGRSPGGGHGNMLQYPCLENPMDRGAWRATVHRVAKSWIRLKWLTEKAMAPHPSTLAWKIPWTEEPGRLQSMGSRRVRQVCATSLSLFTFMHWRRKWQPTPVLLPGESQGWGRTELDTTEVT